MNNNIEIEENYLMPDRIQLSVSIRYILNYDDYKKDLESYYQAIFTEYLKGKKEFNIYFDRAKSQYYVEVPEDSYKEEFPFVSHIRLRINNPFTVTFEFNFARFIRYYLGYYYKDQDLRKRNLRINDFDEDYDLSTRVADDNYVNKRVYKNFKNDMISVWSEGVKIKAIEIAEFIIGLYIEDFDLLYDVVTIKQIEFNKDYFVGHHKSSDVLHNFKDFIFSSSGVEWINKLSGVGISVYNARKENNEEIRVYGDLHNPTFKFSVAKGIFFKVYRKTTDYIRFEITQQGEFIKKKFGKQGFDSVFEPLRDISKGFFRKADFKSIIECSVDNNFSYNFPIIDNIYNFIDKAYPELSSVVDSVIHLNPISDPEVIRFINGNKRFRGLFERKHLSNGRRVILYKPFKDKIIDKNKDIFDSEYDVDFSYMKDIWKSYKKEFTDERVFLSRDGSKLVHKGNN